MIARGLSEMGSTQPTKPPTKAESPFSDETVRKISQVMEEIEWCTNGDQMHGLLSGLNITDEDVILIKNMVKMKLPSKAPTIFPLINEAMGKHKQISSRQAQIDQQYRPGQLTEDERQKAWEEDYTLAQFHVARNRRPLGFTSKNEYYKFACPLLIKCIRKVAINGIPHAYYKPSPGKAPILQPWNEFERQHAERHGHIYQTTGVDGKIEKKWCFEPLNYDMDFYYSAYEFEPYSPLSSDPCVKHQDPEKKPLNSINGFKGFQASLIPKDQVDVSKFQHILDWIKIRLCGNDEKVNDYHLAWWAHFIQHPEQWLPFMIWCSKTQGVGKTTFLKFIRKYIVGEDNYQDVDNLEDLLGDFNSLIKDKLLVTVAEMSSVTGTKSRESAMKKMNKLKNLVDGEKININAKYVNKHATRNVFHGIGTTNNPTSILTEAKDRRIPSNFCSEEPITPAIMKAFTEANTQEVADHFFSHLAYLETEVNVYKIIQTDLVTQMKDTGRSAPIIFMDEIYASDTDNGDTTYVFINSEDEIKIEPINTNDIIEYTTYVDSGKPIPEGDVRYGKYGITITKLYPIFREWAKTNGYGNFIQTKASFMDEIKNSTRPYSKTPRLKEDANRIAIPKSAVKVGYGSYPGGLLSF